MMRDCYACEECCHSSDRLAARQSVAETMVDRERPDYTSLEINDRFGLAASQTMCEAIITPTAAEPPLIALNIFDDCRFTIACR